MRLPVLFSLIFLPIIGHATIALEIAKAALIAGNTASISRSQITPEPPADFFRLSLPCPKNMCLSDPVLDLFTEQTEKPKTGYYIAIKDKGNAFVYFSLKDKMVKNLGLIQLMQEEDDTPKTMPYEMQIPETLTQVTVNGVRTLLESYQSRFLFVYYSGVFFPEAQKYAELLHAAHFLDETDGLRESLLDFSNKSLGFIMCFLEVHQKFHLPVDILHLASVSLAGHAQLLKSNREDLLPAIKLLKKRESAMERIQRLFTENIQSEPIVFTPLPISTE